MRRPATDSAYPAPTHLADVANRVGAATLIIRGNQGLLLPLILAKPGQANTVAETTLSIPCHELSQNPDPPVAFNAQVKDFLN
jgi:hypothetical protein